VDGGGAGDPAEVAVGALTGSTHHHGRPARAQGQGGELVEGVDNRVYFSSRDWSGRPVQLGGTIVDGQNNLYDGAPVVVAGASK